MYGNPIRIGNPAVVEAGGVVIHHGSLVVGVIVIHETHPFDGIARLIEFPEDLDQHVRDIGVAYHLALMGHAVQIFVQDMDAAQMLTGTVHSGL